MVAVKAHQAAAFLKSPPKPIAAMLFYGTDPGLIGERARIAAQTLAALDNPPGEILRIGDSDLEQDPDRLIVELQTIPMFGGRQVVRVAAGRRVTAAVLEPVISAASGPPASFLIVEAGNLKPTDALRKLFEGAKTAAAIACFPDSVRDLDALVREVLEPAKIAISPEARAQLVARLGADHALSRGEIEKLALYAMDAGRIELADVDAVVGDASELAMDKIIMAAASGKGAAAVSECDRAVSSGESPQVVIMAAQRHFMRLHRVAALMDAGRSLDDATRMLRPPLHFKQKDAFAAQCRQWSAAGLAQAITRINATAKAARLNSALEATLTERLLLELARLATARGRG